MTTAAHRNREHHVELESVACPACGGRKSSVEAQGPDYDCHTCGNQRFSLVSCKQCDAFYLNPRPVSSALPQIYSATDYYSYSFAEKSNPVVLRARLNRDRAKIRELVAHCDKPIHEIAVLDIGAGDGSLLNAFETAGVPANALAGIELDATAVSRLASRGYLGIEGRAEEVDLAEQRFDCVTMIQVIEHVGAPAMLLRKVHRSLKSAGLLLLETPNMAAWDRPLFRRETWGGYHFPRHWTLWDPRSMTKMLNACGFDVVSISTPAAAVLWVWSINHVLQRFVGNGRIARFFSMTNPLALGVCWVVEWLPSRLGKSGNMRVIARKRDSSAADPAISQS